MADNFPTLMDVARQSGDKKVQSVVEVLNQTNEALDDIPWIECNSGVTHITTVRTGLPTATWRKLNSGVPTSGTQTKQIKAGTGMLEVYAEVDKKLVDLSKRKSNFIANRNKAFIEGMGQEMARVMFYGDPANPEEPVGFVNYYNDLNAESGKNILDGGGTGADNTSIWLICWGEDGLHGLYPSGTTAGLKEEYLGQVTLRDEQGGQYEGYRTHYEWNGGFVVTDWRCATRIANVDVTKLVDSATDADDSGDSQAAEEGALDAQGVLLPRGGADRARPPDPQDHEPDAQLSGRVRQAGADVPGHPDPSGRRAARHRGPCPVTNRRKTNDHR